jgi:6-phosphogluconolactonase
LDAVQVFGDQQAMSEAAAKTIAAAAAEAISQRDRFLIALSGGGTPEPVYRLLATQAHLDRLGWPKWHVFWGDERCVPPDDPGSNYGQARRLLLSHIPVPAEHIFRIQGELGPDEAADEYRMLLARLAYSGLEWPKLDLALMGLGADGHTASLFPGPAAPGENQLAAIGVSADYDGRPANRVTLTPPVFNSARTVLFLVTGSSKAEAVAAVLQAHADRKRWPAARIKPESGREIWFLDEAAAASLS